MNIFITNSKNKDLGQRICELLSRSAELKFLVGFFYFSGLRIFYESLKSNHGVILKVLVGLNVDNTIHGLIEHGGIDKASSDEEKRYHFFNSIKKFINAENILIFIKYILCNRPKINA